MSVCEEQSEIIERVCDLYFVLVSRYLLEFKKNKLLRQKFELYA